MRTILPVLKILDHHLKIHFYMHCILNKQPKPTINNRLLNQYAGIVMTHSNKWNTYMIHPMYFTFTIVSKLPSYFIVVPSLVISRITNPYFILKQSQTISTSNFHLFLLLLDFFRKNFTFDTSSGSNPCMYYYLNSLILTISKQSNCQALLELQLF